MINIRKGIAQFRVSPNKLGIETGRLEKPIIPGPIIQLNCSTRKYMYCEQGPIDDEQRFLIDCHFHVDDRYSLFEVMSKYTKDFDCKNSRDKFIFVMKCKEMPTCSWKVYSQWFKTHTHTQNENRLELALVMLSNMTVYFLCRCEWECACGSFTTSIYKRRE